MLKQTLALIGLTLSLGANAVVVSIDTSVGSGGDTYVSYHPNERNVALGDGEGIGLKNDYGTLGYDRKGYLKFDISSLPGIATAAELDFGFASNPDGLAIINVYGLADGHAGEGWDENVISWYTAPGNNTGGSAFLAGVGLLGSVSVTGATAGDRITFTSSDLLDFINLDSNDVVTLMLARADESSSGFTLATKENSTFGAPALRITTTVVPIPAAAWLFGSALLGLVGAARRKQA